MLRFVLGVDPGPTPGIVRLTISSSRANSVPVIEHEDVVQCSSDVLVPVLNALIDFQQDTAFLAYETFVTGPRAARSSTPAAGKATREMVGDLAYWATHHGIKSHARSASEVKPWATDERLDAAGLLELTKGMRHARDAARHALFAAVKEFGLPDPLSSKAGAR
jgi:hypothetical protein